MSMDTVDDLHYAEDLAGSLTVALRGLLAPGADPAARNRALGALAQFDTYCRPTRAWRYEGECREGDTCGCLCGHGED